MLWPVNAERVRAPRPCVAVVIAAVVGACAVPWRASPARAQEHGAASAAQAEEHGVATGGAVYVDVASGECNAAPRAQLTRLLRVELGARLREQPDPDALHVRIECTGPEVLVTALPSGAPARSQRLSLSGVPPSLRPRIVALQVAEIVRERDPPALQGGVRQAQARRPLPSPPPASGEGEASSAAPAAAGLRDGVQLQLFAQASAHHRDGRWLAGAGGRVELGLFALRVGLDAVLAMRGDDSELGSDRALLGYLAPHVAWPLAAGRAGARLGVGYAIGFARITGQSDRPEAVAGTVTGPWMAPYALAAASYALGAAFALHVRAEAGWVALPVIGEIARARNVEISGLWTNLQLGAALAF
jgi:hypothetical protein